MTKSNDKVTLQDIQATSERLKNWGRWGAEDEFGTLNNISPQDIVNAARAHPQRKSIFAGAQF